MSRIKIDWTPEKKEAVIKKLDQWLNEHNASAGEVIMQNDDCLIDAPVLISDLVDDIILPQYIDEDEDEDE